MVDCRKYSEEIRKLEEEVDEIETFENVLTVNKDEIADIKERIRILLDSNINEELLDCLTYRKVAIGALTPFMFDDDLEELMVIGEDNPVYTFDRMHGMTPTDVVLNKFEMEEIIKKVARFSGRLVNANQPLLDGRLPDGSRVNATLHNVTPRGNTITIRKFRVEPLTVIDLIRVGTMNSMVAAFLWFAIEGLGVKPSNILMIGGTACGKTTTLNATSVFIPKDKRILSIEDTLEINMNHVHWIPMETKPPDPGGQNEITMDDLLKNALRMRPDRIIVGEVRAQEALTLFTAMNTGHEGCMATLHANSAREALSRLQSHPMNVPDIMLPALDMIVAQMRQTEDGKLIRRVFEIGEVAGKEGGKFLMNTLFKYNPRTGEIETKLLNGSIIQNLSKISALKVSDIDEEINNRRMLLETMAEAKMGHKAVYDIIQSYYEGPDEAVKRLSHHVKHKLKLALGPYFSR